MSDLVVSEYDGELVVDSRLIAERLGIEHSDWIGNIVVKYQTDVEQAFGVVRFENAKPPKGSRGGRPERYALLKEDQATFYMTLSRNTPEVIQCKIDLVKAFSKAKDLLRQRQPRPEYVPYWYQRMKIALSDLEKPLQRGYFCIYQEIMDFFAQLETRLDYLIADIDPKTGRYLVPDGSIGQGFNKFLRSEDELPTEARKRFLGSTEIIDFRQPGPRKGGWFPGGKDHREIQMYKHVYPKISHGEYNRQEANSYPEKYLMIFKYYMDQYWVPDNCVPYLLDRDPQGLQLLRQRLFTLSQVERKAISTTAIGPLLPIVLALPQAN